MLIWLARSFCVFLEVRRVKMLLWYYMGLVQKYIELKQGAKDILEILAPESTENGFENQGEKPMGSHP